MGHDLVQPSSASFIKCCDSCTKKEVTPKINQREFGWVSHFKTTNMESNVGHISSQKSRDILRYKYYPKKNQIET